MSSSAIVWGILIFVVCMLAHPIIQLIPSKRLKQKVALREYATSLGITIKPVSPNIPKKLDIQYGDLVYTVGYFQERYTDTFKKRHLALRSIKDGHWFWINDTQPPANQIEKLQTAYAKLPDFIKAVDQGPTGTILYWRESPEQADVDAVLEALILVNSAT
ncbi:Uncharacterised protein [BD1-7 clade bacterium]|uniref:Uncharacterized protein n=1 Tax=BD1-7 clade bacterium TaxID=2029982 RepID=A0A5S9PV46_9GAMM|nr:Uncharacterised protein [BD1-7 clade bacterium]CAA0108150.1 Uncharacterised protein [BD1-7 clade bacterium]